MRWSKIQNGMLFAVPLDRSARLHERSGFVPGCVVAKHDARYIGAFFSKHIALTIDEITPSMDFGVEDLLWVGLFGDTPVVSGEWPILGSLESYRSDDPQWQFPELAHIDLVDSSQYFARRYPNGGVWFQERPITREEARTMWLDRGFSGHRSLQGTVTDLYLYPRLLDPTMPKGYLNFEQERSLL